MIEVERGHKLRIENLVSLRKNMLQTQVEDEIQKLRDYLKDNEVEKNNSLMTTIFSTSMNNEQVLIDMEILVPINKRIASREDYHFKEIFSLENALYVRHTGEANLLQNTYNELMKYINENRLIPITPVYNVQVNETQSPQLVKEQIVDLYIGISPNIL